MYRTFRFKLVICRFLCFQIPNNLELINCTVREYCYNILRYNINCTCSSKEFVTYRLNLFTLIKSKTIAQIFVAQITVVYVVHADYTEPWRLIRIGYILVAIVMLNWKHCVLTTRLIFTEVVDNVWTDMETRRVRYNEQIQ